jgi:hypothetical protein
MEQGKTRYNRVNIEYIQINRTFWPFSIEYMRFFCLSIDKYLFLVEDK